MMTGALVERRSPGRRVTHESMLLGWPIAGEHPREHPRIAGRHRDPLFLPVERNLACSLQFGVAPAAHRVRRATYQPGNLCS